MNVPVKLRLAPLTALVVGSMVGGGIFSIPQNIAASAAPAATLLAQGLFTPRKGSRSHARG